jgi:hypothetical protein
MNKLAVIPLALLVGPIAVVAGEFQAMVVKSDKAKNQIVVRTEKGDETLDFKSAKGSKHAREGARVTVKTNDKDGTVREIAPSE